MKAQSSPDIQLMDWKDLGEYYIMILERPIRCEDLFDFVQHHEGRIDEDLARVVMRQATQAAYMSCQRGVLHQDIKKENLLINKDTLEVKLIDFGCGDLLQSASYATFMGTQMYCPPEFISEGNWIVIRECCQLICSCLQREPTERLDLGMILQHDWFKLRAQIWQKLQPAQGFVMYRQHIVTQSTISILANSVKRKI
ncbi:hypothetical protein G5714_000636 [Onychostoma macrolepis]|uniref:non-specific serine/threonine protein kinase n=1 Tax=Onychostoma macrolepis TaxID=369639 RepID=A0A7J6DHW8_9TELE|nr:hypothetical protein G5714_000636 [Onychostoma macrolepis]